MSILKDVFFLFVIFPLTLPFLAIGFLAGFIFWSLQAGWAWSDNFMQWITKRRAAARAKI